MGSIEQPLAGKILLLTGGASGIGLCTTQQAHALGARVLIADLKTTPQYDTWASQQSSDRILYVQTDVTKWPALNALFDACEAKWGDVPDAYAICAGLFDPPFTNFWLDPEQDEGYLQTQVNVDHPIKLTRLAIRKSLGRGKRASVCIISSVGGLQGSIAAPLYCATKHAIVGFVKSMKDTESFTGVKITTLCPAGVLTPLFTSDGAKMSQFSVAQQQFLTPETCATNLLELLQQKKYGCGTVLELTLAGSRVIPEWNIAPTEGPGTANEQEGEKLIKNLLGPILEKLDSEKGKGSSRL